MNGEEKPYAKCFTKLLTGVADVAQRIGNGTSDVTNWVKANENVFKCQGNTETNDKGEVGEFTIFQIAATGCGALIMLLIIAIIVFVARKLKTKPDEDPTTETYKAYDYQEPNYLQEEHEKREIFEDIQGTLV